MRRYGCEGKAFAVNSNLSLLSWPQQTPALQSPDSGLRPAPGLRGPAMIRGTPPGTPSRHRTTNRNFSHESSRNLFPFLSITCRSTRVKPVPSACYPGIGGGRGATSSSAGCQIVPRDFVKTRVREGPQRTRVMRRRWRHSSGAIRTAVEPATGRSGEAFPSPCQGSRDKRFDTWGSA